MSKKTFLPIAYYPSQEPIISGEFERTAENAGAVIFSGVFNSKGHIQSIADAAITFFSDCSLQIQQDSNGVRFLPINSKGDKENKHNKKNFPSYLTPPAQLGEALRYLLFLHKVCRVCPQEMGESRQDRLSAMFHNSSADENSGWITTRFPDNDKGFWLVAPLVSEISLFAPEDKIIVPDIGGDDIRVDPKALQNAIEQNKASEIKIGPGDVAVIRTGGAWRTSSPDSRVMLIL